MTPHWGFIGNSAARPDSASRDPGKGLVMRYGLLWLLGVPIPVLIVIWLLFN
jgi:hypothetical protein